MIWRSASLERKIISLPLQAVCSEESEGDFIVICYNTSIPIEKILTLYSLPLYTHAPIICVSFAPKLLPVYATVPFTTTE
jgi:hypothetical protein